jgi:hypothetical protein
MQYCHCRRCCYSIGRIKLPIGIAIGRTWKVKSQEAQNVHPRLLREKKIITINNNIEGEGGKSNKTTK